MLPHVQTATAEVPHPSVMANRTQLPGVYLYCIYFTMPISFHPFTDHLTSKQVANVACTLKSLTRVMEYQGCNLTHLKKNSLIQEK